MRLRLKCFLFILWTILFSFIYGQINKDFQVLEIAEDGVQTSPLSVATLIEHEPGIPFPDVFTLCWRSRTAFARESESWNYIEIPFKPGERFLTLYQLDYATHSRIEGKKSKHFQCL